MKKVTLWRINLWRTLLMPAQTYFNWLVTRVRSLAVRCLAGRVWVWKSLYVNSDCWSVESITEEMRQAGKWQESGNKKNYSIQLIPRRTPVLMTNTTVHLQCAVWSAFIVWVSIAGKNVIEIKKYRIAQHIIQPASTQPLYCHRTLAPKPSSTSEDAIYRDYVRV